jgi:hypothetical protein
MVIRISNGSFEKDKVAEVEQALQDGRDLLYPAIARLPGLIAFYVAIDRRTGHVTNTSLWESFEAADQMRTLPEMLSERSRVNALGVEFDTITNHDLLWDVRPPEAGA